MADTDDPFAVTPTSPMATVPDARPAPTYDKFQGRMDDLYAKEGRAVERAESAMGREEAFREEKTRALAPVRQRMSDLAAQPLPEPPQQQAPPKPPQQNSTQDQETWLMASGLLGALAGAFTRRHQTNALAAFQGAMEGYNEGSRQKFDQGMKLWEAENKRTLEANQQAMDHYRSILENRRLSMDQMSVELQMAAAQYDDQAMAAAAQSKNALVIAQLYDKQADAAIRLKASSDKISQTHQQNKEREWQAQADQWVNGPGKPVIDAILRYERPPPPTNARTGQQGAMDRATWSSIYAQNPNFDAGLFSREQAVKKQEALIPGRVEAAGKTTEERVGASSAARLDITMRSLRAAIPQAAEAAFDVPSTTFVPLNQLAQMADSAIGDPALRKFKIDNLQVAELWARAMNYQGVMRVEDRRLALDNLMTADSPEAYIAALKEINRFAEREIGAVQEFRRHEPMQEMVWPQRSKASTTMQDLPGAVGSKAGEAEGRLFGAPPPAVTWQDWAESWLPEGWRAQRAVPQGTLSPSTGNMPIPPPLPGWKVEQVQ